MHEKARLAMKPEAALKFQPSSRTLALEPRLLYDAAAGAAVEQSTRNNWPSQTQPGLPRPTHTPRRPMVMRQPSSCW